PRSGLMFIGFIAHWIPSEQIERVRTASGSDRIIKPSSKIAEHKSRRDLIRGDCRDPVATARGSDTQALFRSARRGSRSTARTELADDNLLFGIIEGNALACLQRRNRHADRRRVVIARMNVCVGCLAATDALHPIAHV